MNLFPYITLNDLERQCPTRFMVNSIVCWNKTPKPGSRVATADGQYHFVSESPTEIEARIDEVTE